MQHAYEDIVLDIALAQFPEHYPSTQRGTPSRASSQTVSTDVMSTSWQKVDKKCQGPQTLEFASRDRRLRPRRFKTLRQRVDKPSNSSLSLQNRFSKDVRVDPSRNLSAWRALLSSPADKTSQPHPSFSASWPWGLLRSSRSHVYPCGPSLVSKQIQIRTHARKRWHLGSALPVLSEHRRPCLR